MPHVIDLFAGAGGLSLGAARAGFKVAAAIDKDSKAIGTHIKNFPATKHFNLDVSTLKGHHLLEAAKLKKKSLDGLIGGPPCQGFSNIGQRAAKDERNDLFAQFFRLVSETRPKFFLAENVPGIMNELYDPLRKEALSIIPKDYRVLSPIKVVASKYGAPTTRTRMFFIGYLPKFFPDLDEGTFTPAQDITPVFVKHALSGLPVEIDPKWQSEESGWQRASAPEAANFADRISGRIPEGIGDPGALNRYISKREVSGCMGTRHTEKVQSRYAALGPGEVDSISKAMKLDENGFCPTLRAGTDKDRGAYQAVRPVHHMKPRVITPREGARLQGFPDWFVFHKTKWHSFRQIGNSVSPIVSEYLLCKLHSGLIDGG